jgi:hypothetical protein
VPPRVEYELTPVAYGLKPVFEELNRWAEQHAETLRLREVDDQEDEEGRRAEALFSGQEVTQRPLGRRTAAGLRPARAGSEWPRAPGR